MKKHFSSFLLAFGFLLTGTNALAQVQAIDTVRAGRFDYGKMWTFEYPPVEYLRETYDFAPDTAWFNKARMSALRIPGCSAGFVSPNGLVATNHHCGRGSVEKVSRPGENLLDNGFFAPTLAEERPVPGFYADQLISVNDITDRVYGALSGPMNEAERARRRQSVLQQIQREMQATYGGRPDSFVVQIVSLYNGGRYSAYTFQRYTDLRLVMAPELQLGYFGGDYDNFTYPRYDLDFSLFRVYGRDGKPLKTNHYFKWSKTGVKEGDLVFVIGNPGSTSRLETVAQLEYRRDVTGPAYLTMLDSRIRILQSILQKDPSDPMGIRNRMFGLMNTQKALAGRQQALLDPLFIARKADAERQFLAAINADPKLKDEFGGVIDRMAALQQQRRSTAAETGAFMNLFSPAFSSSLLVRGLMAYEYLAARQAGEDVQDIREELLSVGDQIRAIDEPVLAARFSDFARTLGDTSTVVRTILQNRTPQAVAADLFARSVLVDSASTARALAAGTLTLQDPAVQVAAALYPSYRKFAMASNAITLQEQETASNIGRARFAVYGTAVPPDATFSLRIADGVVKRYEYNGTIAPPNTTFYGMYDRYYSFGPNTEWHLPQRWLNPPPTFDKSTPMNFVTTSDTIGGNSGSPIVNQNLEIVGLNFDRNVEGLSRDFIYLPLRGRNMGVDVRAIQESLDDIYNADRLVLELTTGRLAN